MAICHFFKKRAFSQERRDRQGQAQNETKIGTDRRTNELILFKFGILQRVLWKSLFEKMLSIRELL